MEDGKYKDTGISTEGEALKKLDNFWYHYKWHTIVIAFFLIVFIVCGVQMCSAESVDTVICYAGPQYLGGEDAQNIKAIIGTRLPEDYDGDGTKRAELVTYIVMSKEQILDVESETDADGNKVNRINREAIQKNMETFSNHVMTGDFSICFLDPYVYDTLVTAGRLAKLSDVLGYTPEGAYGECGVKLSELDIYTEYKSISALPGDTVVCILNKQLTKSEEDFEKEIEIFVNLVSDKIAEK